MSHHFTQLSLNRQIKHFKCKPTNQWFNKLGAFHPNSKNLLFFLTKLIILVFRIRNSYFPGGFFHSPLLFFSVIAEQNNWKFNFPQQQQKHQQHKYKHATNAWWLYTGSQLTGTLINWKTLCPTQFELD